MKKSLLLIFLLSCLINADAAISILLVNDNKVITANTDTFIASLNRSGYAFDFFNAADSGYAPTDVTLLNYDLVIWYTSTDGADLNFWYQSDTDNNDLKTYLDNGGSLWVVGNDFLFDGYGLPADTFSNGDFVYDYLGISSYEAQSYGDDGMLGVGELNTTSAITALDTVRWIFPTLWWVDGCLPVAGADTVYKMGPPSYSLSNLYAAIYYDNTAYHTLSFFFDIALIDTYLNRDILVNNVLNFFNSLMLNSTKYFLSKNKTTQIHLYPNPANNHVRFEFSIPAESHISLYAQQLIGQEKIQLINHQQFNAGLHQLDLNISNLPGGVYCFSLETKDNNGNIHKEVKKLVRLK